MKEIEAYPTSKTEKIVEQPNWTFTKKAHCVWSEDDADVGLPGHETLDRAYKRIYKAHMPEALETWDAGDALYGRLPGGIVVCSSYPGNSGIFTWTILLIGDLITVVLLTEARLVHTKVVLWNLVTSREYFQADSEDDRTIHHVTDHGVTWLPGHIDLGSPEAVALLKASQKAGLSRT